MKKTDAELRAEGYQLVTGYRDTFVKFDIWTKDSTPLAQVIVRDTNTGFCTLAEVSTRKGL